jgi:putative endonuclease
MTTENVEDRLKKHNLNYYGSKYTSKANDWMVFISIRCETSNQALKIEKHIKSMKSKTYIENLKKYPEIIQKLFVKYKSN